uniref:Uncharacterized protein n=1 Tax=uncultured marine virus TaxID=186617 RepID=A0A0F7L326_9VIRU|nr:hypothetical protein [uncultured marine virus]
MTCSIFIKTTHRSTSINYNKIFWIIDVSYLHGTGYNYTFRCNVCNIITSCI